MALNKDILGTALYNARQAYTNKTNDELINEYGSIEAARLAIAKVEADIFINHIKAYAEGRYQVGTLTAGAVPVTATAVVITVKIF